MKLVIGIALCVMSVSAVSAELKPESECRAVASMFRMYDSAIPLEKQAVKIAEASYERSVSKLEDYVEEHGNSGETFERLYNVAEIDWQRYDKRTDTLSESKRKSSRLLEGLKKHCYAYYDFE